MHVVLGFLPSDLPEAVRLPFQIHSLFTHANHLVIKPYHKKNLSLYLFICTATTITNKNTQCFVIVGELVNTQNNLRCQFLVWGTLITSFHHAMFCLPRISLGLFLCYSLWTLLHRTFVDLRENEGYINAHISEIFNICESRHRSNNCQAEDMCYHCVLPSRNKYFF